MTLTMRRFNHIRFNSIRSKWFGVMLLWFLSPVVIANTDCTTLPRQHTSEALVDFALQCNPGIQAQSAHWDSQRYLIDSAGRLEDPTLMTGVAPQTFGNDNLAEGYVVELNQNIPWSGVLGVQKEIAVARADASEAQQRQAQVEIAQRVRLHTADAYLHRGLLALNRQHIALLDEVVRTAESKYSAGTGSKSAILQAMHEHHQLQEQAVVFNGALNRDREHLNRLLAVQIPPSTINTLQLVLPSIEFNADILVQHLQQQPRLKQLVAQQQQKQFELTLAEKDRYPTFSLMTRYNSLWQEEDLRWVVGVGVNLPLDFGKRSGRESSIKAEQMALRWQEKDLGLLLENNIRLQFSYWQQANSINTLYRDEFLPLSNELLITARDDYQSGRGDFLTLLTAQQQNLSTQSKALQAEVDAYKTAAALLATSGITHWHDLGPAGEQQ